MKTPANAQTLFLSRLPRASAAILIAGVLASGCADRQADPSAPPAGSDATAAADPSAPSPASGPQPATTPATTPPDAGPAAATTPPDADPAPATAGDTQGGDGSAIELDPLVAADLEQPGLTGELACSFAPEAGAAPMLYAMGVVASDTPATGIVKVAGHVEGLRSPGGFSGMLDDPTFTGRGTTIRIAATGPAAGGGESPPRPATLTYLRADGASRTFEGWWQCGP
ncbi:hypothetical protein [Luteimonas kalidii]|uniref:Uncharacterized protein n=1 Tax=Luteimonas kalidii TaxID=3042025 RepID=A0ABT6JX86_9GAMM|nr:hypothetical protein [Luteimonas kalidii]MDH5835108.1 hypothetical protein [Luteimonas kalidii]